LEGYRRFLGAVAPSKAIEELMMKLIFGGEELARQAALGFLGGIRPREVGTLVPIQLAEKQVVAFFPQLTEID
jgi:hypothetical protein